MTETNINSNPSRPLRVMISGGGTGGHIFPAIAIANALKRRDADTEILFVGALGRMEMERVPKAGYKIEGLPVAGFNRRKPWKNFAVIIKLIRSLRKARKLVADFQPDIAVGVGGYASGPTLKAAQRKGIPTLLQEQNSYAGVTNKLLARNAAAICVAYEGMERFFPTETITLTGNPVRANLGKCAMSRQESKKQLGFNPDKPLVLIVGGSLGARTINQSVEAALPLWTEKGYNILWQTGRLYADRYVDTDKKWNNVKATAFIDDMDVAYRAADLVVSRAGASTISELQLLGLPSVLVPSPNVAEDHQRKNALALAEKNAAVMIDDAEAPAKLGNTVVELIENPEKLEQLARGAASMALPDADELIVDRIYKITNRK